MKKKKTKTKTIWYFVHFLRVSTFSPENETDDFFYECKHKI